MGNPINPAYPVTEVESVETLMDIAATLEAEAARRFEQLAALMERQGNEQTATLFRELAKDEVKHGDEIAGWATREGRRRPAARAFGWRLPETFDLEEAGSGSIVSPYEALSVAVRNEERAFAFYSYLAAIAEREDIRDHAEGLARGELEHISRLRARRRKAYHAENRAAMRSPRVTSDAELCGVAQGLERASASLNTRLADALERGGHNHPAAILRQVAEEQRQEVGRLAALTTDRDQPGSPTTARASATDVGMLAPDDALKLALRNAEEVLQIYLTIAERAREDALLSAAQALAQRATAQLALISAQVQAQP